MHQRRLQIPAYYSSFLGSAAVLATIGQIHISAGDVAGSNDSSWTALTMQAFSYGVGIYLGQEVWSSVVSFRSKQRLSRNMRERQAGRTSGVVKLERLLHDVKLREGFHKPQNIHGLGSLTKRHKFALPIPTNSSAEDGQHDHDWEAHRRAAQLVRHVSRLAAF